MMARLPCLLTLLAVSAVPISGHGKDQAIPAAEAFNWETVTPSQTLEFHDCYEKFQCARLLLPMDWLNGSNNSTVTIAIIKLPAVVDDDDPTFGGTIFTQPGGPGISGTLNMLYSGPVLQPVLDIPGKKHYEFMAFDPRGTGHSLPRVNCFPGVLSMARAAETVGLGAIDIGPESLAFAVAAAKADFRQCNRMHGDFLSYVGTPNVVRDMVAMIDAIEALRRQNRDGEEQLDESPRVELRSTELQLGKPRSGKDVPRLQYIGISYGTTLGNYFASMFPGRVGRMVLDGVVDATDHATGLGWLRNTQDTDKMGDRFFQGCFTAGPSVCALHRTADTSWVDIKYRFWSWVKSLDEAPIFDVMENGRRIFIRSSDVRSVFFVSLYNAVFVSQSFALQIDSAMKGNATLLLKEVAQLSEWGFQQDPQNACSSSASNVLVPIDSTTAVICGDGDDVSDLNNSDWQEYLQQQLSTSKLGGDLWSTHRVACAGWKARPNWLFKGPFASPPPSESAQFPEPGRPAAPLLFTSNRWDPATPLRNAREMAKSHPGAGLLVLESSGHCVTANAMGSCATGVLSEYFDTGRVPATEVTCEPTRRPWDATDEASYVSSWSRHFPLGRPVGTR